MSLLLSIQGWRRAACVAALPLLLAACAPTAQQEADYSAVQHSGVTSAIYDKMVHGDSLSVFDIASLAQAHVNNGVVIRYIRDQGTIYYLGPQDIEYLQKAGVSQSVIDFMVQTAPAPGPGGVYPAAPPVSVGVIFGPYWGGHHWH